MKFQIKDLQLTGKGFISSTELLRDNIKMVFGDYKTQFFEVMVSEEEETRRIGWLVPNSFQLLADFTTHTDHGMKGKSTDDLIEASLVLDFDSYLEEIVPEQLVDLDATEAQEILDKMFEKSDKIMNGNINIDEMDDEKGLMIISPRSNFVFVKTEDASIRVSKQGVYVLKLDGDRDKLVMIDHNNGVHVVGEKEVIVGPGGLVIDGKPFDVTKILEGVSKSIGATMSGLGPMIAGLSGIGSSFSHSFEKDFGKKLNKKLNKKLSKLKNLNFNFDFSGLDDLADNIEDAIHDMEDHIHDAFEDFDDDFDDAYDVDIDF